MGFGYYISEMACWNVRQEKWFHHPPTGVGTGNCRLLILKRFTSWEVEVWSPETFPRMVCFADWVKQHKRQNSHLGPSTKRTELHGKCEQNIWRRQSDFFQGLVCGFFLLKKFWEPLRRKRQRVVLYKKLKDLEKKKLHQKVWFSS